MEGVDHYRDDREENDAYDVCMVSQACEKMP